MKFLPLLFANLLRRKVRMTLTMGSFAVALFLFCILVTIRAAFTAGVDVAGADRLLVINKVSLIQPLPLAYKDRIQRQPGVKEVTYANWFGGVYQDEKNFFAQFAVDHETYRNLYPEFLVPDDQWAAFLADKQGAIVGKATADRFGFKVGDRVPITGASFPGDWEFNVRGIYTGKRPNDDLTQFWFRSDYFMEKAPPWVKNYIGWYTVRIAPGADSVRVARAVDEAFANSAWETRTQIEAAFMASFVEQMVGLHDRGRALHRRQRRRVRGHARPGPGLPGCAGIGGVGAERDDPACRLDLRDGQRDHHRAVGRHRGGGRGAGGRRRRHGQPGSRGGRGAAPQQSGTDALVQVRGVTFRALEVHDRVKVADGRFFTPGLPELVVGRNAKDAYAGVAVGDAVKLGGTTWAVVGSFDGGGSSFDSEIWCDANLLNSTYQRPAGLHQSATARLTSPGALDALQRRFAADPRMRVRVERETDYYMKASQMMTTFIRVLGSLVALVMALGAVFAALNTMYSAVAERSREIATIRALGFGAGPVIVSFLIEALLVAGVGGLIGCLAALPLNGLVTQTMNFQTFSHLSFAFRVTPAVMGAGLAFGLFMGLVGGLPPAVRAARLPVAEALRDL